MLEQEIELRELLAIVSKRWKIIASFLIVFVLVSATLSYFYIDPVYQASTTLLVGKPAEGSQVVIQDVQLNRQLVKTYGEIARSSTVASAVIDELNLRLTISELKDKITVSQVGDTEIIAISVKDTSADRAAFLANGVAKTFISQIGSIMNVNNVSIIDSATTPNLPIHPRPKQNIAIAGMLAIMIGTFAIFALEFLDNTIKTPQDIERILELPMLGIIPQYEGE